MGRLFWKFFAFFWLAQLVTSIGVGVTIWLLRPDHHHGPMAARSAASTTTGTGMPDRNAGSDPPPAPAAGPDMPPPADMGAGMPPPPPRPRLPLPPPVMPLVAGAFVSLLFAALIAWYFSKPIRSLRAAFDDLAEGKLARRVGEEMGGRKDELAELGKHFDRMAGQLEGLVDSQRRLLHDVSHELRSPLARLQAAGDLMQQQPERANELMERIRRETERMDRLVGELLTLARLDSRTIGERMEAVDLREVLTDIRNDAQFEAQGKPCTVTLDAPDAVMATGHRALLHHALENVIRNALKHAPSQSDVGIALRQERDAQRAVISVRDEGPGVPESELAAIFEPFYRSTNAIGTAGYGLGLALTRRVLAAHGGEVRACNRPSGGLQVDLIIPTAAAD